MQNDSLDKKQEIEPTPKPWTFYMDGRTPVIATQPEHIRIAEIVTDNLHEPEGGIADARFIVRACNSHERLIAACKKLIWLETSQGVTDEEMADALQEANLAITDAEGGAA